MRAKKKKKIRHIICKELQLVQFELKYRGGQICAMSLSQEKDARLRSSRLSQQRRSERGLATPRAQ